MDSYLLGYDCWRCGRCHSPDEPQTVCECGFSLLARYDLAGLGAALRPDDLLARPPTLWRYRELLPLRCRDTPLVSFDEGFTPMVATPRLGARLGIPRLMIKDDGVLPTGTFKARGASVGLTVLLELGVRDVAMSSSGNAAEAWAFYGARAGMPIHIALPKSSREGITLACRLSGADLHLVEGAFHDAARWLSVEASARGWFNANAMREPYRVEGKKTLGFEIAEQMGWTLPDVIAYPTGGGVGIVGMAKAFDELEQLGWIGTRRPRFVSVQPSGCAPVVKALADGAEVCQTWGEIRTITGGLRNVKPFADRMLLEIVRSSKGTGVAVDDGEILSTMLMVYRWEGLQVGPEGAAVVAALARLARDGVVSPGESVVAVNTSSGLKYRDLLEEAVRRGKTPPD